MVYIGSYDQNVYALNADTGAKLWSYTTGDSVTSSPTVVNGVVYIGSTDKNFYALNAGTGAKLWSYTTGDALYDSAAVVNGVVYFGATLDGVYALNASTGAKLWSYEAGEDFWQTSPVVENGMVYIAPLFSGVFYALNATTGAKVWSYLTGPIQSAPAVANGIVYVGNVTAIGTPVAYLYALNASTGAKLWSYTTELSFSSPAVANGVVYVGPDDGNVYALNAATGAKLWQSNGGSSPVVVNGTLYVGAGNQFNAYGLGGASADLFLRIWPSMTTVHQGDLLTYAFPVWNLGPSNADHEVLNTQVPEGTTFDYIRISGTPGLGTCTHPPYQGTGQIICHENSSMRSNSTWTVRLKVKVTAPSGTVITENAATLADTPDPNLANNTAIVSIKVQ